MKAGMETRWYLFSCRLSSEWVMSAVWMVCSVSLEVRFCLAAFSWSRLTISGEISTPSMGVPFSRSGRSNLPEPQPISRLGLFSWNFFNRGSSEMMSSCSQKVSWSLASRSVYKVLGC